MTNFSDHYANHRRSSLESPSNLGTLPSPSPSGGLSPTELVAHLVIALSRYHRLLRTTGGRVPAEIEDLVLALTDRARALHPVPHDPCRAASAPSAIPRRLLVTKSEAAEQLCVSLRTLERLISAGRLPLVHVEGAARVRVADLEAYVQRLEADGRPSPSPPDGPCTHNGSKDGVSPSQASPSAPAIPQ